MKRNLKWKNNDDDDNDGDPNWKTSNKNIFWSILSCFECKCDLQCEELISACFTLNIELFVNSI